MIIFGASGVGSTTLGAYLSQKLDWVHLDTDDFYWVQTAIPFEEKVPRQLRINRLAEALAATERAVVTGSLVSWGERWFTAFDLAVFLRLPSPIRLARLRAREQERYGSQLIDNPAIAQKSTAFLAWAEQYDNPIFTGRSIAHHQKWMRQLQCPVLEISKDLTVAERAERVIAFSKQT